MKAALGVAAGITVAVVLVIVGLGVGWALWGRPLWAAGPAGGPWAAGGQEWIPGCGAGQIVSSRGTGPVMMGRRGTPGVSCHDQSAASQSRSGDPISLEEAKQDAEQYVAGLGYRGLEIVDVMEFERNYYAIAREADTGVGAMELLVDKWTGRVGPEMGPNMMWNGRYGMHARGRGMMGRASETNVLSGAEALAIAGRWLTANRPGVGTEERADPFYGYYTVHTVKDGQVEGMLSVHGTTGQVWYHTWHGEFVRTLEDND